MSGSAVPRLVPGLVARPRLFELLDSTAGGRVALISAPAGSGKTMLLASWLQSARPDAPVAWVGIDPGESDATRFWSAVLESLRASGAVPSRNGLSTLAPAPLGQQGEFVGRLLEGLEQLERELLLVLDDVHELRSDTALQGVDELLRRTPANVRVFLLSRRDPKIALHRLRLAGDLVEIRSADLAFSGAEAGELLAGAGVALDGDDLTRLHERTEGWAAGLRLAAMSLERRDDGAAFVAEFSGSERTVADYLLSEVLASQPEEVRTMLLRTCILDRVNGPLADLLTGDGNGARLLADLEEANALVVAVDVSRTWFRYHHLLADLLRLELRRESAHDIPGLHRLAAGWLAEHGEPVEAIRHAQLAGDWALATDLLGREWVHFVLDGQEGTLVSLLAALPDALAEGDAELSTIAAAADLAESRWSQADARLATAQSAIAGVPAERRRRAEIALATVQLLRARRVGDMDSVVEAASATLQGEAGPAAPELQALAVMNLGIAESWTLRLPESQEHLEQALALARETRRPFLQVGCLASVASVHNLLGRPDLAEARATEAIAIADGMGWSSHPLVGVACVMRASVLMDRGHSEEAQRWLERASANLAGAAEPAAIVGLRHLQGMAQFARGRFAEAAAEFHEAAGLAQQLRAPHFLTRRAQFWELRTRMRLGELEPTRAALADAGDAASTDAEIANMFAHLRLAEGDAQGAADAVAPAIAGDALYFHVNIEIESLMLDALARKRLGDDQGAERSVERMLELTEPHGRAWMALTLPGARELLEAYPAHRTSHGAHLKALIDLAAGAPPPGAEPPTALEEPLSERELAVLRFLPTNLSASEIGSEMFVSVHTVKTHMRKLYAKLDVHTRAEAVERGRALGLLGPARRSG